MKLYESLAASSNKFMSTIEKEEIKSREAYALIAKEAEIEYVGLASYYSILCDMVSFSIEEKSTNEPTIQDPEPQLKTGSLKERLCSIALDNIDKLDYHEIRVINLLTEMDRKEVVKILGIKKAILSQIINQIRIKLTFYNS